MPRNHVHFADDDEPQGPQFGGLHKHFPRGILKDPRLDSIRAQHGSFDNSQNARRYQERQRQEDKAESVRRHLLREREKRAREEERRRKLEREIEHQKERLRQREADFLREHERESNRRRDHEREIRRLQQEREARLEEERRRRERDHVVEFVSRDALEARLREERRRRDRVRHAIHEARLLDHHAHERVRVRRFGGGM